MFEVLTNLSLTVSLILNNWALVNSNGHVGTLPPFYGTSTYQTLGCHTQNMLEKIAIQVYNYSLYVWMV